MYPYEISCPVPLEFGQKKGGVNGLTTDTPLIPNPP